MLWDFTIEKNATQSALDGLRAENKRMRELLTSINRCTSPGSRNLDQLVRDMGLACDLSRTALALGQSSNRTEG